MCVSVHVGIYVCESADECGCLLTHVCDHMQVTVCLHSYWWVSVCVGGGGCREEDLPLGHTQTWCKPLGLKMRPQDLNHGI